MDISGLKEFLQRFLKNYKSLVVPVVILVVAVLLFIPAQLVGKKLRATMANESVTKRGKTIQSLRRSVVPSSQWTEEEKYQAAHENDANQIALLAEQSSKRELLADNLFPEPQSRSALVFNDFGEKFRAAVAVLMERINARECPTDTEVKTALQDMRARSRGRRRGMRRGRAMLSGLDEVEIKVVEFLCRKRAESASVYANAADVSGYEYWGEYEYSDWTEAIKDCWYSQLAYWMIEDVINTIGAFNSGSNSVLTSPVKRLIGISFTTGRKASRRRREKAASDNPTYILSDKDALTESCTGRFCNDDIDVVHFNVSVVVGTKDVLHFMQELCSAKRHNFRGYFGEIEPPQTFVHNEVTILESRISAFDLKGREHMLYRYGEDAVVRLDLICEYIFNRNGYDKIKPEAVKEYVKEEREKLETKKLGARARALRSAARRKAASSTTRTPSEGLDY